MNGGTKDGDLSLMLENVKTDDTGRYMCQIKKGKKGHIKTEAIAIINLDVSANSTGGTAGDTLDGHRHIGMVAGLIIVGTTCLCAGIFLKLKKPMINIPPLCSLDEANI
ncbi:hypothetical protein EXN66_Car013939 [Channa argus]|uniref:Immunoglobulin V-set domain-containing protein n=1 Tax=Channa argus TaxID=215402 RepID=A0A6G1Q7K9_CHAAH|nr:hypothetical protein EXN66_Car013939 [Channa argus]